MTANTSRKDLGAAKSPKGIRVKVLILDIETSPNMAHVWGLFNQNIGINQLLESGEVICFAAKWHDSSRILYYSTYHHGKARMVEAAYELVSEADAVVHYNGKKFDMPHLNREFILMGYTPPSPYAQIDLLHVVKRNFRFTSNKLDYVSQALGLGEKTPHTGHQLWLDCLSGDAQAWRLMRKYNKQDVLLTEALYDTLLPWIATHPSAALRDNPHMEEETCPNCSGTDLRPQGRAYTSVSVYQRFKCADCGKWSRGNKRIAGVDTRGLT